MTPLFVYKHITILLIAAIYTQFALAENLSTIKLEDTQGKYHALSEFIGKGQWVVLNIWGPGCPPCREEMPDLVRFHDSHINQDAMVLGIAIDFPSYGYADRQKVKAFMDEYLVDFPVLLADSEITTRLGLGRLQGLPTTYVYTPEGSVAGMQVGGITESILNNFISKQNRKRASQRQ